MIEIARRDFLKMAAIAATAVTAGLPAGAKAAKKKTVRLFILSGQSNAAGNGNGEQLSPEDLKIDPEVLIYRGGDNPWQPMYPEKLTRPKQKFNIESLKFGAELAFSKELKKAYPDDIIAVAKVAVAGGTSIIAWEKDRDRPGWMEDLTLVGSERKAPLNLYDTLISDTSKGVALLKERKDVSRVIISGMLWLQTESDGNNRKSARAYGRNLTNLIKNVRADLKQPKMPFMFFDVHMENNKETRDIIRNALRRVVKNVPFAGLVLNNDLPTYEGVHFNTEGMMELGRRFAAKYRQIINERK